MSDLLSASSLLMAISAILFSLWYAEIAKALEIAPKTHREDNIASLRHVRNTLLSKAMPVALMAFFVALIFIPDAVKLIYESIAEYDKLGLAAIKNYDAVRTAYCFVTLLSTVLAAYMVVLAGRLWNLSQRLR